MKVKTEVSEVTYVLTLSHSEMLVLIFALGYIPGNQYSDLEDRKRLHEMWVILKGYREDATA